MRKLLLSILLGTGLAGSPLFATATETPEPDLCLSSVGCFSLIKADVPEETLNNYPSYASLGRTFNTGGERAFVFDPRHKRWGAYDSDGYLVASGIANGGADFCAELGRRCHTPTGTHRVGRKGTSSCTSSKYPLGAGGAPMPYCMFFRGGYAIHGSPYISNRNGSHGCIRVKTTAARWLHKHFMRAGTKVIVLPY